ncbi:diaminopimelate epimerase [bacterium]|nr:diaminopimelate epimerase [bacterium]
MLKKKIKFLKMSGGGNDFIIIDNRKDVLPKKKSFLSKQICLRKISVGADGVVLVEKSRSADFKMRIFNPDGSEAEMCGNGARCVALFSYKEKIAKKNMCFETKAGKIYAQIINDKKIKIKMSKPFGLEKNLKIKIGNKTLKCSFINTGVPHTIIFTPRIENLEVENIGRQIRWHKMFAPEGTNVDFVSLKDKSNIYLRTYERGVEAETLSCGTGSVASAIIAGLKKGLKSPLKVITQSGEIYTIYFRIEKEEIKEVYLEGPVAVSYEGIFII